MIPPGSVNIREVSMTLPGSIDSFSITRQVVEINIHEDMFSPHGCVHGTVVISDAIGLSELIPFTGQESIFIDIEAIAGGILRGSFWVYAVTDRKLYTGKKGSYILHFTSKDYIRSQVSTVSRSYKDMTIKDMIRDIENQYDFYNSGNSGPIPYEDTVGNYSLIIPNLKPIPAIHWLSKRAVSTVENNSADFIYYETLQRGFQFRSISSLVKSETVGEYYYTDQKSSQDNVPVLNAMTNILSFEFGSTVDTLQGINEGRYASILYQYDFFNKNIRAFPYSYLSHYNKTAHLEPGTTEPGGNNQLIRRNSPGGNVIDLSYAYTDADAIQQTKQYHRAAFSNLYGSGTKTQNDTPYINRKGLLSSWDQIVLNMAINGTPPITCGDIITVNLPSTLLVKSNEDKFERWYSGRAMVTALRHRIRPQDYKTYVQLRKDSFHSPVPDKREFQDDTGNA